MQPRNKTWKVEETTSAFFVTEIDDRHTFNISKKMVQNYVVDYDPAFTEDLHYFDLLNGQVLFFSEVDVMLTEPRKSGEDGPAVIYELSDVLNEAFSLIRSAKPLAAHSLTVRRQGQGVEQRRCLQADFICKAWISTSRGIRTDFSAGRLTAFRPVKILNRTQNHPICYSMATQSRTGVSTNSYFVRSV